MKSSAFYAVLGLGIILVVGVIWWGARSHEMKSGTAVSTTSTQTASNTPPLTGLSIYTNGNYGFSIFYPATSTVQNSFNDGSYNLPSSWRLTALPNATGTPIIEIIGNKTAHDAQYAKYFEATVRVGVSSDPKEVAACEKPEDGELSLPNAVFGGATWKVSSFQSASMQLSDISYRTLHDGQCFALEQLESGQGSQDLSSIIKSFSFARK